LCESGLIENHFFHDDDDEQAPISTIFISYLNYGSSKCGFSIFAYLVPATSSHTETSAGCHPSSHFIQITIYQKKDERYQPNVNKRSKCLVGSPEKRYTVVLETPTRSDSSTAAVAIPLAPYQIAAFFTSPYDDNKTCPSSFSQSWGYTAWKTDYRGHLIAASVAVTGGGDEISYPKAVVEQMEGY
jgi:hypothetical protein